MNSSEVHSAHTGADAGASAQRSGRLALALQEVMTVIARIRSDRQVADDADAFRAHVKRLLGRADSEARDAGYDETNVRLALYAAVAVLDESVLNSPRPMFRDWPGRPLQEEIFGDHVAGDTFYRYLDDLLTRPGSEELADVLEVFHLCLLLGFRGRYGTGDGGERDRRVRATHDTIRRIRGPHGPMAPSWNLPADDRASAHGDPWVRKLALAAAAGVVLVLITLGLLRLAQGPGLREVRELTAGIVG